MEKQFNVQPIVSDALVVWKTRYQYLYTLFLPILVVSLVPILFLASDLYSSGPFFVLSIVIEILYFYILMATTALVLRLLRANEEHPVKDLTNYGPIFLKYLVVNILYGLMIFGGLILLIVPGIYLAVRYAWVGLYTIENPNKGIKELFGESAEMTAGHRWEIFWLLIVLMLPIMVVTAIVSGVVAGQLPEYQNFVAEVANYALVLPWALLVSCTAYLRLTKGAPSAGTPETVAAPLPEAEEKSTPEAA